MPSDAQAGRDRQEEVLNSENIGPGVSRRTFMQTGVTLSSSILFFAFTPSAAGAAMLGVELPKGYKPEDHYYGYAIDIARCIGCGKCVDACKTENDVSRTEPNYRTWVERYVIRSDGSVEIDSPDGAINGFPPTKDPDTVDKSFFVPKICGHCELSPCEQVCPVGASLRSPDGVVLIDKDYCIGCGYCIQACPYGCRYFDEETKTAGKCTLCYHRITKGLKPACVEVCPRHARIFGDLKQKDGELATFLRTHNVNVLKPQMNTKPKLSYANLDREVR